jgi:hypothetical protein
MTTRKSQKQTPFHVRAYPGELLGKFPTAADAQRVASMWSRHWGSWAEVDYYPRDGKGSGLIGQFSSGEPTAEFAHLREMLVANHILAEPQR